MGSKNPRDQISAHLLVQIMQSSSMSSKLSTAPNHRVRGGDPPKPECSFKTNASLGFKPSHYLNTAVGLPSSWPYHLSSALLLPPLCLRVILVSSCCLSFPLPSAHGHFWALPNLLLHDALPLLNAKLCPLCCVTPSTWREELFWILFPFIFFGVNWIYDIYGGLGFFCFVLGFFVISMFWFWVFFFLQRARLHSVNWKTNPPYSNSVLFIVICPEMGVDLMLEPVFLFQK